jgi:putative tryptophan/tyrosine transport system substrate-binding protein
MKRREFIALLGGVASWPLAARGQQAAMPVNGYLSSFPADINPKFTQAFQQGLNSINSVPRMAAITRTFGTVPMSAVIGRFWG